VNASPPATILIADDDQDTLELLVLRLEHAGYETLGACNGADALGLIRKHHPSLCVLDVQMPKLDGFGVVHAVRAEKEISDTPVILLTASVQDRDVIRGLESGADDYLRKPFDPIELETRVAELLNGR